MRVTGAVDRTVFVEDVMGTVASLDIRDSVDEQDRQAAAESAMTALHEIDEQFSSYRSTSEVSRYASGQLGEAALSKDLREVLRICTVLEDDSDGVFRRQRPESLALDVAGLVKGWAIDRAGELLRRHGMHHWCLTVGGDVLVSGGPGQVSSGAGILPGKSFPTSGPPGRSDPEPGGSGPMEGGPESNAASRERKSGRTVDDEPWRVAVRDPFDSKKVRLTLPVVTGAIATSGSYERGAHVWDGRSGRRAAKAGSFTVVGPFMTYADAYATVGYVMGFAGLSWVSRHPGYEALRVAPDGSLSATQGFRLPVKP